MIGQAVANGLFIAAVNRVGTEDLGGAVPAPVTFYVRASGGASVWWQYRVGVTETGNGSTFVVRMWS